MDRNVSDAQGVGIVTVALRKESVDRNKYPSETRLSYCTSLSARRAWIEMGITRASIWLWVVALRKESVDRNRQREIVKFSVSGRSPQGERG